MSEETGSECERMSAEEVSDVVGAMSEFSSAHPWRVLTGIAGLEIDRGSVEEQLSNRKPPREIAPDTEIIAIDECLGLYKSRQKQIVLFQRGIAAAAKILNCEAENRNTWSLTMNGAMRCYTPARTSMAESAI